MANTFSTFAPADLSALLAGRNLTGAAVAPLGEASNWCAAHVGSGTPRIWETWARRGNSAAKSPQWTTDSPHTTPATATWAIPGTRGASTIVAWVWGGSAAGAGKAYLTSETAADTSAEVNLASGDGGLAGPLTLDVDPAGDVVTLHVHGHDAIAWASSIVARTPPETSPLAAGVLPSGCVGVDAAELAYYQTLSADQGRQIRDNAELLRAVPHVYWSWSGVSETSLGDKAAYMRACLHSAPALIWPDTQRRGWTLTVKVLAVGLPAADSQLVVCALDLPRNVVLDRAWWPGDTQALVIPSGTAATWYTGTIRLRAMPGGDPALSGIPTGVTSCTLAVIPAPSQTLAADWSVVTGLSAEYQTTAEVMSISAWGR